MENLKELKVVFMGTGNFAGVILKFLISSPYKIISVFTQPEKKAGRQGLWKPSEVKKIALLKKLTVFEPEKFTPDVVKKLKVRKPDLIVLADYGKILPKEILSAPRLGALNVHASLLPKFRGPSPIQNALLQGEKETGATIMLMNEKVDAGDILNQKRIKIKPKETYSQLLSGLANLSGPLLLDTLGLWIKKKIKPRAQDESQATFCQLIEREDGKVIWDNEASAIYNQFRAFCSWPGLFTYWENNGKNLRLKLNQIRWAKTDPVQCRVGEVFKSDQEVAVKASGGIIILEEVQLEGKKSVKVKEFLNGHPNFIGSMLK